MALQASAIRWSRAMQLFLSFEGRISRRTFWFGILVFLAVGLGLSLLVLPVSRGAGPMLRIVGFLISLVLLYPLAALLVKRLHDRDTAATPWAYIHLAAIAVSGFVNAFKIGFVTRQIGSFAVETPGAAAYAVLAACMLVNLGMFIMLGFFRGTPGPNRYGPSPRAAPAHA